MMDACPIVARRALAGAITVAALASGLAAQTAIPPRADYAATARSIERFITHERETKDIPAVTIALVEDQTIVWAQGFGLARPRDSVPATAATVYRVGPVSTLFTAIALMQLVEQRRAVLDSPVTAYLPDFAPRNPFGVPVTLRHLLTHHGGLVREPPVGGAFDAAPPPLAETVASLNTTTLVYRPGSRFKYSNAGVTVIGRVVEQITGAPFPAALRRAVLEPAGMRASAFVPPGGRDTALAAALMWAPDGRRFPAPTFALGTGPAGGLHAPVTDLARFLAVLFADGRTSAGGWIVRAETLADMWEFGDSTAVEGVGLGVAVTQWEGRRRVGQDGAVSGFATHLAILPDDRLGVVVTVTRDGATAVAGRIADHALRAMLAVRAGRPVPEPITTSRVPAALAARLAGSYYHGRRRFELQDRPGGLFFAPGAAGLPRALGRRGDTLVVDDPLEFGLRLLPLTGEPPAVVVVGDTFTRMPRPRPDPPPERWVGLLGEYGRDHGVLFIREAGGRLHAVIEWFYTDPLEQVAADTFAFPAGGRYRGERLVFARGPDGRATAVALAGTRLPRRAVGPHDGRQLRVNPTAPVAELLAAAHGASPPEEPGDHRSPDLVELVALDSTIRLDIRYATTENFLGTPFYAQARALLQRPAALALVRAQHRLRGRGYGLLVYDGYRPWYVTKAFWDATPPAQRWMVADPSAGSRHNRGCAVDVTLVDLRTGVPVDMGGTYDETTPRSYPDYPVAASLQRWHRELLRETLVREGFRPIADEWWHFDCHDWQSYPLLNVPLDRVENRP